MSASKYLPFSKRFVEVELKTNPNTFNVYTSHFPETARDAKYAHPKIITKSSVSEQKKRNSNLVIHIIRQMSKVVRLPLTTRTKQNEKIFARPVRKTCTNDYCTNTNRIVSASQKSSDVDFVGDCEDCDAHA